MTAKEIIQDILNGLPETDSLDKGIKIGLRQALFIINEVEGLSINKEEVA